jgi:hypothetical protein
MYALLSYLLYIVSSLFTILIVGRQLHGDGKTFLFEECEDVQLSISANNFLYLCYVLLNSGFALLFLKNTPAIETLQNALEFLASSQGFIFLSLGSLHFLNLLTVPRVLKLYLKNKSLTSKNQKS